MTYLKKNSLKSVPGVNVKLQMCLNLRSEQRTCSEHAEFEVLDQTSPLKGRFLRQEATLLTTPFTFPYVENPDGGTASISSRLPGICICVRSLKKKPLRSFVSSSAEEMCRLTSLRCSLEPSGLDS